MNSDSQSESQETSSTAILEDSYNISFVDLSYNARRFFPNFTKGYKSILNSVSGCFNGGELTVIMGQSGAGKSTLLDILAGRTKPTSGRIYVNSQPRNYKDFRRRSCYIMQDDKVQDQLTIQESLNIAADLKLGNHVSEDQKKKRVEEIITSLNLISVRDTRAGKLSGGQKKRLAIGLELVSDPPVMFLDEPTSGLDSSISKQIVYLLHLLARQGRTVVVTMHQPSATLIDMVDRLYTMVEGRCVYMGSVQQLIPFFQKINQTCPKNHSRVDFLIELSCTNGEQMVDRLVEKSENGKSIQWSASSTDETDKLIEDQRSKTSIINEVSLTTLPPPNEDPSSKILLKLKSTYSTSFWKQFTTLTKRSLKSMRRDPFYVFWIPLIHLIMAAFISCIYFNIGRTEDHEMDNYKFLTLSTLFMMFTAFSSMSIFIPERLPVVRREHFNRWYTPGAYYTSTLISVIPTNILCTFIYTMITFFATGQPTEPRRFFTYWLIQILTSFVALCMGLLNGSIFSVKFGAIMGPFVIMPFLIFSGFFLTYTDASVYFKWLFQVSFMKHGLDGILLSIYGMNRTKSPCTKMYCHYAYPRLLLIDRGIILNNSSPDDLYHIPIIVLLAIASIVAFSTYVVLKIRLKHFKD